VSAKVSTVEQKLAELAVRSHGVVTRAELLEAGVSRAEIGWRERIGGLIRIHRGVFRVGHAAPSLEARYMAAVKACGPGSLLAGRAAGYLLRLLNGAPPQPEVFAPTQRKVPGVITHRCRISQVDGTRWCGIPITTVPRTLVDLAPVLPEEALARAVHEADVLHRVTPDAVERVLGRRHNWPGASRLRRVLWGEVPVTVSALESSFIARLRDARLPQPALNRRVDGRYVDCRWPDHRLTIELDGYRYHHTRHAWEQDRHREREARARGDEFRRYTWMDVNEDPEPMLADLHTLLLAGSRRRAASRRPAATPPRAASEPRPGSGASSATGSRSAGSARG
jgi:very-short-patch-repair endonuclease